MVFAAFPQRRKDYKGPQVAPFGSMVAARDPWGPNFPLFEWAPGCPFTLEQSFASVAILGEIGASKTTGSAAWLLLKFLENGFGGLVCCVKPGDRELIEQYALATGRSGSLIIVSPNNKWRCNLVRYAQKRPGATGSRVEQIVSLLMTIVEAAERSDRTASQGDRFWSRSLRELLRNSIEICAAARSEATMSLLHEVITSAPNSPEEVQSEAWQKSSLCYQLIEEAEAREKSHREQADFELAATYFLRRLPAMPNDTRGSILATYGVMADVLLRGHMADLFDCETNFVPDLTFEGAIIVLDLPLKVYGQAGLYVQSAFTYLWQRACEQRNVKTNPRPNFYFSDEFHELISSETARFFATSRGVRIASLVVSQNIPGFIAAMGGDSGRHHVDAFLSSCGTIIGHANGCQVTNRWMSDKISEAAEFRMNFHGSRDGDQRHQGGASETVGRKVLPSEFTMLKKGGAQNNFMTDVIVYQTGAAFSANRGEPWLRTTFKQLIPGLTLGKK